MTSAPVEVKARKAGFLNDLTSVAERALRSIPRDPEGTIPPLIFPVFFFAMAVGSLQVVAEEIPGLDFKSFQIPVAVIFAVTGVSRAIVLVTDIQSGYFDRLSLTPANRLALLLGLTVADFAPGVGFDSARAHYGLDCRSEHRDRRAWFPGIHPDNRNMGSGVYRFPLCNSA